MEKTSAAEMALGMKGHLTRNNREKSQGFALAFLHSFLVKRL